MRLHLLKLRVNLSVKCGVYLPVGFLVAKLFELGVF